MSRKVTRIVNPIPRSISWSWLVGATLAALVLVFFWHPFWRFVIDVATSADHLFPGSK